MKLRPFTGDERRPDARVVLMLERFVRDEYGTALIFPPSMKPLQLRLAAAQA